MKIQCACGAKFSFEVSPEMVANPVRFVCPTCGADSSERVNQMIRQELGASQAPPVPRIRLQRTAPAESTAPLAAPMAESAAQTCAKHPGEAVVANCQVCNKPLCARCLELFGYVCSPLCKAKAGSQGRSVPEYSGQKWVSEARWWRRLRIASTTAVVLAVTCLGVWIWYAWFASVPKVIFSVRFDERSYSGTSKLCGDNQLVFLHGGTLARYDLASQKEIWSRPVLDTNRIHSVAMRELKALQEAKSKADQEGRDTDNMKIPSLEKIDDSLQRDEAAALQLHIVGENVWLVSDDQLTRYDWATGTPAQTITLRNLGGLAERGNELVATSQNEQRQEVLTHIDLTTGTAHNEVVGEGTIARAGSPEGASATAGLPVGAAGADGGRAMDPSKVAAQAQHLSLPARIALPAVLANNMNQDRTLAEMDNRANPAPPTAPASPPRQQFDWVPARDGAIQFSVRLLESHLVNRSAMKPAPGKSALDGAVSTAQTGEVANEILNDMQRQRGGDIVVEDQSRYQVTLRQPGAKDVPDWTGEVVGHPDLYPLPTVNVITAGTSLIVLDKTNRKLWESRLSFPVQGGGWAAQLEETPYGEAPCVEHKGSLYVIDQAVITAFDLTTGNVRWRYQTVGVVGLFFDDRDNIYVNTTTAGLSTVKFSRQIDISQKTSPIILKLDPKTGRKLWSAEALGLVSYASGKFIYTMQSYQPDDSADENPYGPPQTGFETQAFLRIRRVNPENGAQMWEHFEQRCPLDAQFDRNQIRLVFRKEVEVLKFLSL